MTRPRLDQQAQTEADLQRLQSIPDVGPRTAPSAAAYCGLSPREFRSRSSVRDLPTLTAIRCNPLLQGFFDRLVAAGKPKMQAVGAYMR